MRTGNFSSFPVIATLNGRKYSTTFGSFPWGLWLKRLLQQVVVVLQQQQSDLLPPQWPAIVPNGGTCTWGPPVQNNQRTKHMYRLLSQVGKVTILQVVVTTNKYTRKYSAFLVPGGHTGNPVAVLETDIEKNATYIFRAHMPGWKAMAECSKDYLRQNLPQEYVKKINHSKHFDRNLLNLIKVL